jgi:hypothetical protein
MFSFLFMKEITSESTLAEVMKMKGSLEVLAENKVPCVTCPFARMEMDKLTIGQICEQYGIDCDLLLTELNAIGSKKRK